MKNRLTWLLSMAALALTVGCGPMEPGEEQAPAQEPSQSEEVSASTVSTCRLKCDYKLENCKAGCGGNLGCRTVCVATYNICVTNC
ncbi:hypothetical protein LY474_08665 [Myxococcus stipitatus]|uniref:hypothetical protein n=1 Tax=Myxococcus stipitatus TaxID=83455 RepID=UPI001F2C0C68|nr:hypothetical protein [Myxococcus stipitatus]MCE9667880.1 hypothetical protein [Myxococcus stipitatus]